MTQVHYFNQQRYAPGPVQGAGNKVMKETSEETCLSQAADVLKETRSEFWALGKLHGPEGFLEEVSCDLSCDNEKLV